MPSCSLGCTQMQAHHATKNCCFSNIRSRDGAKSTLWQAHTKYDSIINRPRKLQTKKINKKEYDRNWQIFDEHITEILQEHDKYMTRIWQQYDRSMPKLWQIYDWIMTGVWQLYDKNMTEILWQEYDKYMTRIWQNYDRSMTNIWQQYDNNMTRVWQEYHSA